MTMTRIVPFRSAINDVAVLQNRLNSIFHDFAQPQAESLTAGGFVPAVDVYEDEQKIVLTLEVPGIPQENLDIRVEGRTLTVKGERKFANDLKEENFQRVERRFGSFTRTFTLPASVNTDAVTATTADGILTISFARKAEAAPKQIQIQAVTAQPEVKQVEAQVA